MDDMRTLGFPNLETVTEPQEPHQWKDFHPNHPKPEKIFDLWQLAEQSDGDIRQIYLAMLTRVIADISYGNSPHTPQNHYGGELLKWFVPRLQGDDLRTYQVETERRRHEWRIGTYPGSLPVHARLPRRSMEEIARPWSINNNVVDQTDERKDKSYLDKSGDYKFAPPGIIDEYGNLSHDFVGRPPGTFVDDSGQIVWDPIGEKYQEEPVTPSFKGISRGNHPYSLWWLEQNFRGRPSGTNNKEHLEQFRERFDLESRPDQRGFLDWKLPTRPTAARFAQRRAAEDPSSAPKAKATDAKPLSKDAQRLLDRRPPAAQGLSGSTFAQRDLPGGGFSGGGGMDRLAGGLGGAQGRAISDRLTARAKEIGADLRNARKGAPDQGEGKRDPKDSAAGRRADALIGSDDYWRNETKQREVRGLFEEMYGEKTKPRRDPKDSAAGRRAEALIGSDDYWRNDAKQKEVTGLFQQMYGKPDPEAALPAAERDALDREIAALHERDDYWSEPTQKRVRAAYQRRYGHLNKRR